jgi:hypothetical protein
VSAIEPKYVLVKGSLRVTSGGEAVRRPGERREDEEGS